MWSRAPLILTRYPRQLVALAVGALLLVVAGASYPLFISAVSSSLVRSEIREPLVGPYRAGVTYKSTNLGFDEQVPGGDPVYRVRDERFRSLTADGGVLGEPVLSIAGPEVIVEAAGTDVVADGRLFAGEDALQHVDALGEDAPGDAWIPDLIAEAVGVEPGETITLRNEDRTTDLTVAGVYRALYPLPRRSYWLQWTDEVYPTCPAPCPDPPVPPQPILVSEDALVSAAAALGVERASFGWQAPLATATPTLEEARRVRDFVLDLRRRISDEGSELWQVFRCCDISELDRGAGEIEAQQTIYSSAIAGVVDRAEERLAAVESPGRTVQVAGLVVALAVLAAGGVFGVGGRVTEGRLLSAMGMSPAAYGAKAALEAVLPAVAGTAVGLGASIAFVNVLGPPGRVGAEALRTAAMQAALASVAALVAVGLVSALSFRSRFEHHGRQASLLARLPWELVLVVLAYVSYRRIEAGGGFVADAAGVRRPSPLLLLFPLASIGAAVGVVARIARLVLARVRPDPRSAGAYLAMRRLAGGGSLPLLLMVAAGLSLGVALHAQALVGSMRSTLDAKARVFVGSDAQVVVGSELAERPAVDVPTTSVVRMAHAGTVAGSTAEIDLLAIDPATFVRAAFWQESFSDEPIDDLVASLDDVSGGRLRGVLVGSSLDVVDAIEVNQDQLPVTVEGRASAFPGMLGSGPMLVVGRSALEELYDGPANPLHVSDVNTELWLRGSQEEIERALARLEIPQSQTLTAEQVQDIPYIAATLDTFVVLQGLAVVAAVLVLVGLLMYVEARQRSQLVAYGLSLRMGVSRRDHRRALGLELGAMLLGALVVAIPSALGAALLMAQHLDALETIPPRLVVELPVVAMAAITVILVVVIWAAARTIERRASRRPLGEVLRLADE